MSVKTSFVMHSRYIKVFEDLPGEDVKRLILAMGAYVEKDIEPDFSGNPALTMAFRFIRASLDEEGAKWEETRNKRIKAGHLGGVASAASRGQAKQVLEDEAVEAFAMFEACRSARYMNGSNGQHLGRDCNRPEAIFYAQPRTPYGNA